MRKSVRVRCIGKVQGVFFRASTQQKARELGVKGWVKNQSDGSVLGHFEGEEERVDALVDWAGIGPPGANVTNVEVEPCEFLNLSEFEIKLF